MIGESVHRETAIEIRQIVESAPCIARASWLLTMYLGPDNILLALDVQFRLNISGNEITSAIKHIENKIRSRFSMIKRIFIETIHFQKAARMSGDIPSQLNTSEPSSTNGCN